MKHNDIPFDIDPELSETADRGEVGSGGKADCAKKIWPPFGEMIFPAPITDDERAIVAIERSMKAQRRAGPFWTGSKEQWAQYDAQNNIPVDGFFNPFENVATYGRKNLKRPWRPADLSRIKLDTRFFPKELHAFIDKDDGTDEDGNPIKRQKTLGLVKKSVLDRLAKFDEEGNEEAEPAAEDEESVKSDKDEEGEDFDRDPGDTNYEDEEDDFGGGDYNAEQYFDGGDEDFDEGGADEYADDG